MIRAKTLGIDIGSSSVKVSCLDTITGKCVSSHTSPSTELPIVSLKNGWAEQDPQTWWDHASICIQNILKSGAVEAGEIGAIGVTYQMHGLVTLDESGNPLRKSIIWCDSRAVPLGIEAVKAIGEAKCLEHLLNYVGNFTASKLAWVKRNEPSIYEKVHKFMLPGDYIVYKLTGEMSTTESGISEQILWDFKKNGVSELVLDYYGISEKLIPSIKPNIGVQSVTSSETEKKFGIRSGTPISFRSGDQPNNAFSLNVLNPGEIAATGGTSGVVYGVTDQRKADKFSRVNTFLHVNHSVPDPRYGVLLCINGTGILNAWVKRIIDSKLTYEEVNKLSQKVPPGSEGLIVLPFGNGAERMLRNSYTGGTISGIDLNRHTKEHVFRAAQEGIAFSFKYGIDIMKENGVNTNLIRAGNANLFLSPLFRKTLATVSDAKIELYNTDGSLGAARGAALGAGIFKTPQEAFKTLTKLDEILPDPSDKSVLDEAYARWKNELNIHLQQ